MLDGARWSILVAAALTLGACTYRFGERDAFRPRKLQLLTETVERHNVEIPQPVGATLRGWYLTPKAPRRHMVFLYGNGSSVVDEYAKLHWLAQTYDMDILVVDYPGYGFSDGSASVEAIARASVVVFDSMAARWPRDDGPIFVYGHSLGTVFAVYVGVNRPRSAVILEAPLTSVQDLIDAKVHRVPWFVRPFVTIKIDEALTRWRQPVDMIKDLAGPLLVIHGTDDQTIPVDQGRRMFEAAATTRKHLCEVPGEDHYPVQPNREGRPELGCLTAFLNGNDSPATVPAFPAQVTRSAE